MAPASKVERGSKKPVPVWLGREQGTLWQKYIAGHFSIPKSFAIVQAQLSASWKHVLEDNVQIKILALFPWHRTLDSIKLVISTLSSHLLQSKMLKSSSTKALYFQTSPCLYIPPTPIRMKGGKMHAAYVSLQGWKLIWLKPYGKGKRSSIKNRNLINPKYFQMKYLW